MATLTIRKYPDPVLRKKSQEVKEISNDISTLIYNMIETMDQDQAIGLSAPQVGESKRIIVINTKTGPKALINPKIIFKGKKMDAIEEGCLSFPGLYLEVKRPIQVEIEALNAKGEQVRIKAEGMGAKVIQHEIDHLDAILFIDRLGFWQKFKLRHILKKWQ